MIFSHICKTLISLKPTLNKETRPRQTKVDWHGTKNSFRRAKMAPWRWGGTKHAPFCAKPVCEASSYQFPPWKLWDPPVGMISVEFTLDGGKVSKICTVDNVILGWNDPWFRFHWTGGLNTQNSGTQFVNQYMVIAILRSFSKQVILISLNWNLSGTYQYWATNLINGSKNLIETCARFNSADKSFLARTTNGDSSILSVFRRV